MSAQATAPAPTSPPARLTEAQIKLLVSLIGNRCAWRVRNGWRLKGAGSQHLLATANALIRNGLAMIQVSKGPPRLVLTGAGEIIAEDIQTRRKQRGRS